KKPRGGPPPPPPRPQTRRDPGRHPCQYPYPRLRYGFLAVRVRVAPIVPAGYPCHCLPPGIPTQTAATQTCSTPASTPTQTGQEGNGKTSRGVVPPPPL